MTRYEKGFMDKCAEYGLDKTASDTLMKTAKILGGDQPPPGMLGASKGSFKNFSTSVIGDQASIPGKVKNRRYMRDLIMGIHRAMPTMWLRNGRLITNGELEDMMKGLTPMQRALAFLNPNAIPHLKRNG